MKTEPGRYIDALSDFGFKFYFGSENHKDILIAFLNDLFKGQKIIKDLIYSRTEHTGDTEEFKRSSSTSSAPVRITRGSL